MLFFFITLLKNFAPVCLALAISGCGAGADQPSASVYRDSKDTSLVCNPIDHAKEQTKYTQCCAFVGPGSIQNTKHFCGISETNDFSIYFSPVHSGNASSTSQYTGKVHINTAREFQHPQLSFADSLASQVLHEQVHALRVKLGLAQSSTTEQVAVEEAMADMGPLVHGNNAIRKSVFTILWSQLQLPLDLQNPYSISAYWYTNLSTQTKKVIQACVNSVSHCGDPITQILPQIHHMINKKAKENMVPVLESSHVLPISPEAQNIIHRIADKKQ